MILRHPKDHKILCHIHRTKVVQLGSCLQCRNVATICQVKGCMNYHEQNQRAHNVLTLEQVRHVTNQYVNSNNEKRSYLKKMVHEYFKEARKQVQRLFTQIYESIDRFVFEDIIFLEDEQRLIQKLIDEQYEQFTCEQMATLIPKLIKSIDFQDGHFTHLRNYLIAQKEKVTSILNSVILNLPQFRWKNAEENVYRFYEVGEELLKDVNTRLSQISYKPKRLKIKYIEVKVGEYRMMYDVWDVESGEPNGYYSSDWYIRIVEGVGNDDLYSWDIDDNEYQLALVEAMLSLPCITSISIFTSYSVKSIDFLEELVQSRNDVEIKILKKTWDF